MSDLTVGCIRTTTTPPLSGGVYEVLLEKANRENDELQKENERLKIFADNIHMELMDVRKDKEKWGLHAEKTERDRDRYKQGLEEISTTIQEWLDSIVQEPAVDFIHAIKAWADKKLNEQ